MGIMNRGAVKEMETTVASGSTDRAWKALTMAISAVAARPTCRAG